MLRRTAKIGAVLLGLMLCALGLSLRHTPVGWGLSVPSVMAQTIWQQKCQAPLSPIVGPTWQVSNNVNGQLLQWGCIDTFGNFAFAGTVYAAKGGQLSNALADLQPSGGTVIVPPNYTETITSPLVIGSASQVVNLLVDRSSTITINITSGTDAIQIWSKSSLVGIGEGNALDANFILAPTANVSSLLASYPRNANAILNIRGLTFKGNASATVSNAMFDLFGITDQSTISDSVIWNFANTYGVKVTDGAGAPVGPFDFNNITINGMFLAGAKPVLLQGSAATIMGGVNFFGGSLTHPGAGGNAIVDIQGIDGNQIVGVNFYGTQIESSNVNDIGININNATNIGIHDVLFTAGNNPGATCIKIAGTSTVYAEQIFNQASWTNTLQNTVSGLTIPATSQTRLQGYFYYLDAAAPNIESYIWDNSSGRRLQFQNSQLTFPSFTFAALPASPNGTIIFCSDCNATCAAGAGTGRHCARENGAWVGF